MFQQLLIEYAKHLLYNSLANNFLGKFHVNHTYVRHKDLSGAIQSSIIIDKGILFHNLLSLPNKEHKVPAFLLSIIMGLVLMPFMLFSTAIKLLLLFPRSLIILGMEKRNRENLKQLGKNIDDSLKQLLSTKLKSVDTETNDGMLAQEGQTFNGNIIGRGILAYVVLYQTVFGCTLIMAVCLLRYYQVLPKIHVLSHTINIFYPTLVAIIVLSIASMALSLAKCFEINKKYQKTVNSHTETIKTHLCKLPKILRKIEHCGNGKQEHRDYVQQLLELLEKHNLYQAITELYNQLDPKKQMMDKWILRLIIDLTQGVPLSDRLSAAHENMCLARGLPYHIIDTLMGYHCLVLQI